MWCEWRVFSSLTGLNSVFLNALQNAKQLFHIRLPQMTKYCVMREYENIRNGYLYVMTQHLLILKGIYGFKFPKRFLEISSRDLTLLAILIILRPDYPIIGARSLYIRKAECLATSSQTFPQAISGESMTQTEKGDSTIHSIGETPGEKVHHCHKNVDAGSNGGNVNQHKQTRVEVDSNSTDQLHWRCPHCSYTNDEDISRAVFGDTNELAQVCLICYISCPCDINSA